MATQLWEILVPRTVLAAHVWADLTTPSAGMFPEGFMITCPVEHHRAWDRKVAAMTGGLTVADVTKGRWIDGAGELAAEEMIAVRVACSATVMRDVAAMTKVHYRQDAVAFWLVSPEFYVV